MAAFVFAFCAFKIGGKVLKHIKTVSSDPMSYGLCKMASPQGSKNNKEATTSQATTTQADPELANPPVLNSNSTTTNSNNETDAAPTATPTNDQDFSPADESPQVAPKPMTTTAAAATTNTDTQGLQDNITHNEAAATATVIRRQAGPKSAPKPLQDYSLLAPPHIRQLELEYWRSNHEQTEALKACRLQFENCRWYQQAYN
jgi:hypothetical protein